jgi:hyperosmotically inducible periplasmic protein
MKTTLQKLSLLLVVSSSLAFLMPGCAGTSTRESTGEYLDDRGVTARVKTALIGDEIVKARDINVETFKGTVQLSGFVDSQEQKARAASIAAGINGVRSVENNISVKNK